VLTYVNENHAIGYDIHKGLKRNISGTHSVDGDYIVMLLNEPGDNKYDGKFKLKIDKKTFDVLGDWSPVSSTLKSKMFTLTKRVTKESDSLINENNFSERFGFVSDTLGEMSFERDGSCTYTYVPVLDAVERREQEITVKGNWSLFNKTVNITWEQNNVFTSGESEFTIREEEYSYSLVGEKRELFVEMY
jgi:hypothetical protein